MAEKSDFNMFSEAEQDQLQLFLNDIEQTDNESTQSENIPKSPVRKRTTIDSKKRASPYSKNEETSHSDGSKAPGRAKKPAHELLSDDQKKANHIASEQKRRANIKIGFDQLVSAVPTLDSCHRSESVILQKSVGYIRQLIDDKNDLQERVRELQMALGETPDDDSSDEES